MTGRRLAYSLDEAIAKPRPPTAAEKEAAKAKDREALEAAGWRWHTRYHSGDYGLCPRPVCYHTNRLVSE